MRQSAIFKKEIAATKTELVRELRKFTNKKITVKISVRNPKYGVHTVSVDVLLDGVVYAEGGDFVADFYVASRNNEDRKRGTGYGECSLLSFFKRRSPWIFDSAFLAAER